MCTLKLVTETLGYKEISGVNASEYIVVSTLEFIDASSIGPNKCHADLHAYCLCLVGMHPSRLPSSDRNMRLLCSEEEFL